MKKQIVIIGVILDLLVYGIVYYFGYRNGKQEAEKLKHNIELDVRKIAENR